MAEQKKTEEAAAEGSKELTKAIFTVDELQAIESFDDALRLATEKYGAGNIALASDVIGDGFKLLENKDQLIGIQMIVLSWTFNMGDFGEYASARIVTHEDNGVSRKYVVNDGSTGIRDQLMSYEAKTGRTGGLLVSKGFRRSDYEFEDDKGKKQKGTTYYLDLSV